MFQHVIGYGGRHLLRLLILTKVFHKVPIRSNQVHDDTVVNLESWRMGNGHAWNGNRHMWNGSGHAWDGNGEWNFKLTK